MRGVTLKLFGLMTHYDVIRTYDHHKFPDGESRIRVNVEEVPSTVAILAVLDRPDEKLIPLWFLAETLRDLGADTVGLIVPYLPYMRQDRRFHPGEGVSARYFATMLSRLGSWLVTVDPHLHRFHELAEVYSIPFGVAHSAPLIAKWIHENVTNPVLVGPDEESLQWVSAAAEEVGLEWILLEKVRKSDRKVEVSLPETKVYKKHTPVLVDDIISTGETMTETVRELLRNHMEPPVCIGIHAVYAVPHVNDKLEAAGASQVVTTNTIPHASNAIDVTGLIADQVRKFVPAGV
jgi:ribose-phosphate pyrophosphokinase